MTTTDTREQVELVAERLRIGRQRAGKTQTQVAEALGVAPNTVSGWEAGTRMPRAPELAKLVPVLGCTADYLIGVSDSPAVLPVGGLLIDQELVDRILACQNEAEIIGLVDWDPQMMTFWHVVRSGMRVGSEGEIERRVAQLAGHVQKIAPTVWREWAEARRHFALAKERSCDRVEIERHADA